MILNINNDLISKVNALEHNIGTSKANISGLSIVLALQIRKHKQTGGDVTDLEPFIDIVLFTNSFWEVTALLAKPTWNLVSQKSQLSIATPSNISTF